MPTYGYQCTDCKHEFQVFQSMKDDPIAHCPQCTGSVKRLLYPVGIVFKGSGWYVTDARKPEPSESRASEGDSTGDKPASEPAKSASEPAKSTAEPSKPADSGSAADSARS